MISKISPNVSQLYFDAFGSTVYILELNNKIIMIDTSSIEARPELLKDLKELNINLEKVNTIILTHTHWDHNGNLELFPNATIVTSNDLSNLPKELKPIKTPGHTKDSICFLYQDILFSGDTIFHKGGRGRTDLPGGSEEEILESIKKLEKIKYNILCPGHV
jgi:glyoxylase-like metal-dependent hydrolase (beta-lactamase superfamily II)